MLQIKTIRNRLDNPTLFDDEVNAALRDGWTLKKRTVIRPIGQSESVYMHTMLYVLPHFLISQLRLSLQVLSRPFPVHDWKNAGNREVERE